ncbi:MAG: hypothetical protein CMJ75_16695 [Planctomycetaceae bacterium]|nr:hypothetical protein [Planctomycetaceae bacterium]
MNLLFPPHCVYCGCFLPEHLGLPLFCTSCTERFRSVGIPFCSGCGTPGSVFSLVDQICLHCHLQRRPFDCVVTLGVYDGDLRQAVLRMKRITEEPLVVSMGILLAAELSELLGGQLPDAVVPVPMLWSRRVRRGTNNVGILAQAVAETLQLPVLSNCVRYQRNCKKQSSLPIRLRRQNVQGAFRAAARYDIKECHILVIDDVMTTGATAGEVTKVVKAAGAAKVTVAVVARGIRA